MIYMTSSCVTLITLVTLVTLGTSVTSSIEIMKKNGKKNGFHHIHVNDENIAIINLKVIRITVTIIFHHKKDV